MITKALRFSALMAFAYAAACVSVFIFQRSMIYHPATRSGPPTDFALVRTEAKWIETRDGYHLQFWYSIGDPGKPFVVFFHGNAGNLEDRQAIFRIFEEMGYGYAALDYRGYGNSQGSPAYGAIMSDSLELVDKLRTDGAFNGRAVVLFGESLGTAVATHVAAHRPVDGLMLKSPYTSVGEAVALKLPFLPTSLMLTERYSNVPEVSNVSVPLLVVHGVNDELFPVDMARRVLASSGAMLKTLKILQGRGHNDIEPADMRPAFENFADALKPGHGH